MSMEQAFGSSMTGRSMNRRELLTRAAASGLAVSAFTTLTLAGSRGASAADPLRAKLDAILAGAVAKGFPGIVLQVERGGKTIYIRRRRRGKC